MPFSWPLSLIKRLVINRKIKPTEEDGNMTNIESAVNELHSTFNVALNPDGTLKNNSVGTSAIQDRAVTLRKLALLSSFWCLDTGGANAMVIAFDPVVSAYAAGQVYYVQAAASVTGAATLNAGAGAVAIKKIVSGSGKVDLAAGDIFVGGQYVFVHDGTHFVLLNPAFPPASSTGPVFLNAAVTAYSGGSVTWATYDASAVVPAGAKAVKLQIRNFWNTAIDGEITTEIRADAGGIVILASDVGASDAVVGSIVGDFPIKADRTFQYQVTTGVAGATSTIKVIGYVL